MASYHLSVGVGKKGSGGSHASYVSRTDEYENFKGREELVFSEHGNMPSWAEHDPTEFFRQADLYERKNGSVYREYEIAIPNELTSEQQIEFVKEFVQQEIGKDHPYLYGIHNHRATIDGEMEQPHAHIMFSDRKLDGIERNPEEFFKRYNSKNPEKGGCQKANTAATPTERKEKLVALRERFATLQNAHLEKHGHEGSVDHRSLKDRGITRPPEKHLGPVLARDPHLVKTLKDFRLATIIEHDSNQQVRAIDLTSSISEALHEREKNERAKRDNHPSRSQAPAGLDGMRTVRGIDNIHDKKLSEMLLQQDAHSDIRQPNTTTIDFDLHQPDRDRAEVSKPRPQSFYSNERKAERAAAALEQAKPVLPSPSPLIIAQSFSRRAAAPAPTVTEPPKTTLAAFVARGAYVGHDGVEHKLHDAPQPRDGALINGYVRGHVELAEGKFAVVNTGRGGVQLIKNLSAEIGEMVEGKCYESGFERDAKQLEGLGKGNVLGGR